MNTFGWLGRFPLREHIMDSVYAGLMKSGMDTRNIVVENSTCSGWIVDDAIKTVISEKYSGFNVSNDVVNVHEEE